MFTSKNEQSKLKKEIIDKLLQLKPQAKNYSKLINDFHHRLAQVDSSDNFLILIQEIVAQGKQLHEQLFDTDNSINSRTRREIFQFLESNKELSSILELLRYSNTFQQDLIATHERLSDKQLAKALPEDQLDTVRKCINDIRTLKPTSELIEAQIKKFRTRLDEARSLDELEAIEAEIKILDKAMSTVYDTMIAFPENENTAGVVIDYLEKTPHLRSIMKRFNLLELLTEDILNNTARLHEQLSLN